MDSSRRIPPKNFGTHKDIKPRNSTFYTASPSDSKFRSNPTHNLDASNRDSSSTTHNTSKRGDFEKLSNKSGSQRVVAEQQNQEDLFNAPPIVGTCPYMCPEKERAKRERLRDLAVFERLDGKHGRTSSNLAVKKFCRTISTKNVDSSDLRPLPVLNDTLKYLLELSDSSQHPFEVIHDFIFDRMRSIRQDLSMQNIVNEQAIWMFEEMVRFHVISHHKLQRCSGDDPTISSMHHLNMEQLNKSLASLYNLYDMNRNSDSTYENEAEFRSLFVLLHLGPHKHSTGESLSLWFQRLSPSICKLKEMCFARRVLRFFRVGNFWQFFHTVSAEATYLQFCILEPYMNEVRAEAIACINHGGYKLHPYPLEHLSKILKMEESDLESFCKLHGLEISVDDVGNKGLPSKQTSFCHPKAGFHNYAFVGLEQLEM